MWLLFAFDRLVMEPANNISLFYAMGLCTILSTHALSETHIAATLARVYKSPERRQQFSLYTHWAALCCALLGIAGLFVQGMTPLLAKIYMLWIPQHFTAQTYGFVLMYCYRAGYRLSALQKNTLRVLFTATALFAALRQLTYKSWNPDGFLAQRLPFWGPLPEWMIQVCAGVLIMSAVLTTLLVVRTAVADGRSMPLPAILTLITGVLIFVVGRNVAGELWVYVPAFYHGSQYVVLSIVYFLREGRDRAAVAGTTSSDLFGSSGLRYQGLLLLLAIAIFIGLPRMLGEIGVDYTLAFAIVFVCFNLHHLVTDQAIWKLRDPKVRNVLLA